MKTSTAPGESPAINRPAANGVEAVAQMYIGMPITTISSITGRPEPQPPKLLGLDKHTDRPGHQ